MNKETHIMLNRLQDAGISVDDALALRRIAMTLHRWFELECGDGNNYGSWCITRGHKKNGVFEHDDDGKPYLEHHHYRHGKGEDSVTYSRLSDRENGARKRLVQIMAKYPGHKAYVQTDPRGAPLYILTPYHIERHQGQPIDQIYNHGIAVYK